MYWATVATKLLCGVLKEIADHIVFIFIMWQFRKYLCFGKDTRTLSFKFANIFSFPLCVRLTKYASQHFHRHWLLTYMLVHTCSFYNLIIMTLSPSLHRPQVKRALRHISHQEWQTPSMTLLCWGRPRKSSWRGKKNWKVCLLSFSAWGREWTSFLWEYDV